VAHDPSLCDDVRAAAFLGRPLDAAAAAHVAGCAHCTAGLPALHGVADRLRAWEPAPPPGLSARVMQAAAPLIATHAPRALWGPVARALGAALVPLPFILVASAAVLRVFYGVLCSVLPETLSFYLVLNSAAVAALLAALTYGSIPLLAAHQARLRFEGVHD
jgi:hypothetical protein